MRMLMVVKREDEDDVVPAKRAEGVSNVATHTAHGAVVNEILGRVSNPPATWSEYPTNPSAIVEMEYREYMAAKQAGETLKAKKELKDLAAACLHALNEM